MSTMLVLVCKYILVSPYDLKVTIIYGYKFYRILKIVDLAVLILAILQLLVLLIRKCAINFNINGYNF